MPTTPVALAILLVLIVPGFMTRTVISASIPRQQRSAQEWIAEVAAFGAVTLLPFALAYALASWLWRAPAPDLAHFTLGNVPLLVALMVYLLYFVVIPVVVGFIFVVVFHRGQWTALYRSLGIPHQHPAPRAWDWYFSQQQQRLVVVTLLDGAQIAGFMGRGSFAASYPAPEDLYLERVYPLQDGMIGAEPISHSAGVWIQGNQIGLLEFYIPRAIEESGADSGERRERPTATPATA